MSQEQFRNAEHDLKHTRSAAREAGLELSAQEVRVRKLKEEASRLENSAKEAIRVANAAAQDLETNEHAAEAAARRLDTLRTQIANAERDYLRVGREADACNNRRDAADAEAIGRLFASISGINLP